MFVVVAVVVVFGLICNRIILNDMFLHKVYFSKSLSPEIWVKLICASQITVFLNQCCKNKIMKKPDFLQFYENSRKLKND